MVLAIALGLRLWGVKHGLPYVYNVDEETLFLKRAARMIGHSLNPHYFENPPGFTYMLYVFLTAWFGTSTRALHEFALHPETVYVAGRAFVAVLGTCSVWLLYLTGSRFFSRKVGLLAAAVMAVAFLPVFYAHLALNDVPMLAPLTLTLFGAAGIWKRGQLGDYLVAGFGVGATSAIKYTGGVVILSLAAACVMRCLDARGKHERRHALTGLSVAGLVALMTFVAANPYSVGAFTEFHAGILHQATDSAEPQGKLGAPKTAGLLYYLWTFTWGLGWIPSLAALIGSMTIWRDNRRLAWILVPTVVLFLVIMGFQTRYFGRWLLPVFPIICLLSAYLAIKVTTRVVRWLQTVGVRAAEHVAFAILTVAMCIQGFVYCTHSDVILSRPYTFEFARRWMIGHIPAGSRVVVEPVVPNAWLEYSPGSRERREGHRFRWVKLAALRKLVEPNGKVLPPNQPQVNIEDYERTLNPALLTYYVRRGYCWILSGTTQSSRAYTDQSAVPNAINYYRLLAKQGEIIYRISPYHPGSGPVGFNFDWAFDYYPLAYAYPGAELAIYRLYGGRCGIRTHRK